MKKSLILSIVLLLLVAKSSFAQSWNNGSIKGEGEVVKQEISLSSLKGIDLGFSGNVILTPGSVQKIVIEAQPNIIDNIKREVRNGVWRIHYDQNVKEAKTVNVYITVPAIGYVALTGSGDISSTGRFTGINTLEVAVSGSGDIHFDADADNMDLALSGSGDIELAGSTSALEIAISGSGNVTASSLKATSCKVHISGSGDVEVQVNGDLESNISGSGDVHYSGNASVTARISGSGSVSKL